MHKTKAFCFAALVLIVATITDAPAKANDNPSAEAPVITVEGTTITYVGKVSVKNVGLLLDAVKGEKLRRW